MVEILGWLLVAVLTVTAVNLVLSGTNNVHWSHIQAAEIHCSSHGGIKYFDNDYIRQVVCADGLVTRLSWVMKKYHQTP